MLKEENMYPPIYKDGVNVNPDGNETTTTCTCLNCRHNFVYQEQYGKVKEILDLGEEPQVPTVELPTNPDYKDWLLSADDYMYAVEPTEFSIPSITLEDLVQRIEKLEERTEEQRNYINKLTAKTEVN